MNTPDKRVEEIVEKIGRIFTDCFTGEARKWGDVKVDIAEVLTEYHQDLMSEMLKEIDEANWHMHLATKSRLKTFIKTIIKSK